MWIDWIVACCQQWRCEGLCWYVLFIRIIFSKRTKLIQFSLLLEQESKLDKLIKSAVPLPAADRADLLYNSQALESAHQSAATQGQSSTPNAEDNIDLHYVCFVKDEKNNFWEMDGRRRGPLELGALEEDEDVLSEKALNWGVRKFLKREEENGAELRFSLIALAPCLD